ncbi:hypothetical protein Tco_0960165 [Tanacetum coccineum]
MNRTIISKFSLCQRHISKFRIFPTQATIPIRRPDVCGAGGATPRFNDSLGRADHAVQIEWDRWSNDSRTCCFTTSRAVWHEPEQFSSELNRAIYRTDVCTEPQSWSGTVTAVSEDRYRGRGHDKGLEAEQKQVENMEDMRDKVQAEYHVGKDVNMAAEDSDDALVCCVENMVADRIKDSGASFQATYCKEELERFKLRSGKVRLAYDINLDIAGVGDVVLKTSFDTSWTLKDVRYISGLKKRLISVWQLDEEGYHVGFGDQQWKVTKGSLVVARGNKPRSIYMVEVHSEGIGAIINDSGSATLWFGEAEEAFLHNVREDKETVETAAEVAVGAWNEYLRKGRKTKPKRQNRTRNGKAWKRQSQDKAQV